MKISISLLCICMSMFNGCINKEQTKTVNFSSTVFEKNWPIQELNPELPTDWSSYKYLTFEINASSTQRFFLNLHDAEGIRRMRVQPFQNAWVRASIPLIHFQKRNTKGHDMAAIGKTALPGLCIGFTGSVGSINQIDSIGVSMDKPVDNPVIEIRNVCLTMEPKDSILSPLPVVDEFGQWIPVEWPGKAKSLDELKEAWQQEESELESGQFNYSKYGGYLNTQAKASGFFRVEKIDGKWWFIDPEGHYFFSAGSTCVNSGGEFARVEGREYIYKSFPSEELIQSDKRIRKASFTDWNLYRRYGADWYPKWMDLTIRRMEDWGFNTIANWSDPAIGQSHRKAYVATLRDMGISSGIMGMPDIYAPDFADKLDQSAARQCAPLKNDPFLLGYFVGNEPPWPGREVELMNEILKNEGSPIQKAFLDFLADGDTPERRMTFIYDTYKRFMTEVNTAIKKYDPNHLNLGLRFGGHPSEKIITASANVGFDVFSMNIYEYSIGTDLLKRIDEYVGLPVLIGEFHFGVVDRGLAPGLKQTINQEERGVAYRYYVENAAAHPSLIGTHWFQWRDQPATGRGDGENYNIGLVDVTDRPYKELIDAAKETHKRIFNIHAGNTKPTDQKAIIQK